MTGPRRATAPAGSRRSAMRRSAVLFFLVLNLAAAAEAQTTPSAIGDIQNWFALGLPMVAEWNAEGFPLKWHVDQVRAGHRLLPSVFLPHVDLGEQNANNPSVVQGRLKNYAADLA